jgi:hypothetical protein
MSDWLDDAAQALAAGRFSRRQVLRRAAAVAGGGLVASLTTPVATRAAAGEPCGSKVCSPSQFCCAGRCFPDKPDLGCCHDATYDPRTEHCCPLHRKHEFHVCDLVDETCCGENDCCKHDEFCCAGRCFPRRRNLGCCHDATYDPASETCCPLHPHDGFHVCAKDETCCGRDGCCGKGHECCGSGGGAHCVPKGKCHESCGGSTCGQGQHCCHGRQCCTGPCCHDSCCVGPDDQCCSNNGGCCGPKDICCPQGCCIYGCTADGGCAPPPSAPDIRLAPRRPRLARRRGHA